MKALRPTAELPDRLRIAIRRHRHHMAFIADVDAGYMAMNDFQPRILGFDFPD